MINDEVIKINEAAWEKEVKKGGGHCTPWLELDVDTILQYISDNKTPDFELLSNIYPISVLDGVNNKNVLCLASGGGQQSAVFGLLGANVTVVDISNGQLEQDILAAKHYGYEIQTFKTDMQDLACLEESKFDLIYQAPSMCYIPDIYKVYCEAYRLLNPRGTYRVEVTNPATMFVDEQWAEEGYRITKPYSLRIAERKDGAVEHRHYLRDIFNGLIQLGFKIEHVEEAPWHLQECPNATPGSWQHIITHIPWCFVIVANK